MKSNDSSEGKTNQYGNNHWIAELDANSAYTLNKVKRVKHPIVPIKPIVTLLINTIECIQMQ